MIRVPSSIRKTLVLLASLVLLGAILYVFRINVLVGIGNFLVIHDKLEAADAIFLLNGDPTVRPVHAVTLFRRGLAPTIVIARAEDSVGVQFGAYPNPTDSNITMLKNLGVPESRIIQLRPPGGVKHTFDEAKALLAYSRENPLRKVIIVTSDLHSRRARFIFLKILSGTVEKIMFAPVSDRKYGATNWWTIEDGVIGCQNEYIKLLFYHLKY
jgi:uncharacterized SAM-binding protein YcdF (DUF218 family)